MADEHANTAQPMAGSNSPPNPPEPPKPAEPTKPPAEASKPEELGPELESPLSRHDRVLLAGLKDAKERTPQQEAEMKRLSEMAKAPPTLSRMGKARLAALQAAAQPLNKDDAAELDRLRKAHDARAEFEAHEKERAQKDAAGPFSPEQWAHLKAWVRREMRMSHAGMPEEYQDARNP